MGQRMSIAFQRASLPACSLAVRRHPLSQHRVPRQARDLGPGSSLRGREHVERPGGRMIREDTNHPG
jgi:hypothetical protein